MKQLFKITLRNDYAFKRVFGVEENKDVLQDLLECVLDIPRGLDKGAHQKALETAKVFKQFGFDINKIAEGTGLPVEEIEAL